MGCRVYFVFVSVLNLWIVSVFWSFMADNFGSGSARRLMHLFEPRARLTHCQRCPLSARDP